MQLNFGTVDTTNASITETAHALEMLTKNSLMTTGVVLGAGTAVAAGALVTAALPAQMITATAVSGGLIYAGHRQDKGLPINPLAKADDKKPVASVKAPAVEEPVAA